MTSILHFLIGAWLTSTPLYNMATIPDTSVNRQNQENTSTFLIEFSEPMDTTNLTNINNYSVVDYNTGEPLPIIKIGLVTQLEDIVITGNKLVAIITNRVTYKHTYHIVVTGVRDMAGNYIAGNNDDYYYFSGLRPSFGMPSVGLTE